MASGSVFQRYELKYLLTREQQQRLQKVMQPYMKPDNHGAATVRNLYFDTDTYLLIRRSIEKPVFKEKMRIRCYETASAQSTVFVELKRKYKQMVYKRRIAMPLEQAHAWVRGKADCAQESQIAGEIAYFLALYRTLQPTVFLSYKRQAFYARDGSQLRVTFDEDILCRQEDLSLSSEAYGTPLLPDGFVLMEIKCAGGIPLWLTAFLSGEGIRKTSFSKYGTAYCTMIFPKLQNRDKEASFNA